jgi:hypothetical protein
MAFRIGKQRTQVFLVQVLIKFRMFDIIFSKLLQDTLLRPPMQREYKDIIVPVTQFLPQSDDLATFSYHLDLLLGVFRFGNQSLRAVCADDRAVLDPSRLELLEKSLSPRRNKTKCRWTYLNRHDLCCTFGSYMSAVRSTFISHSML